MESTLATLRLRLVDAQARLRNAKDELGRTKAEREQAAIRAANGTIGKNADERERALIVALATDPEYRTTLALARDAELAVNLLEAQIENACDIRRAEEWQVRCHLADVLATLGTQSDSTDPATDVAFDDATLDQIVDAIERIARDKRHQYAGVAREMVNAYSQGLADRVNGAGEYEPDDEDDGAEPDSWDQFSVHRSSRAPVIHQRDLIPQVDRLVDRFARGQSRRLDGPTTALDYYNGDEYRTQMDLERADADAMMYEWQPETWHQAA